MRLTRRSVLAGAGAALAPAATSEVRLPRKVRVGLVDVLGHVGDILDPLPRLPDVEIVAVAQPDPVAWPKLAKHPRLAAAKVYPDWQRMLDDAKPDLVAVCNANGPRAAVVLGCADRGLPVIAEKPIALTRADLERIRHSLERHQGKLSTLLPMRFEPVYLALRDAVRSGAVGEIINITAQKSYKPGNRPAWMRKMETYGGTIPWIGIHMIDLMRFTSGREVTDAFSYRAQVKAPAGIGEMENTTGTVFRLDNHGVGTLHMDYCRPESSPTHGDDRLRLAGTGGVVEYMAATGVTLLAEGRKPESLRELPPEGSVFVDFLEHVYNGKPAALTFEDVYRANRITIAAQEAAESGRPVKV